MKFNIKIYIPVTTLGLSLLLSGCGDSFLEKSPSDYITSGDLQEVAKWNSNIFFGYIFHYICYEFRWYGWPR